MLVRNKIFSRRYLNISYNKLSTNVSPHTKYPNLLSPLQLTPNVILKNRVLMGSMHTGLEENGFFIHGPLDEMANFYAERAKGEVGLIVTGGIAPNLQGSAYPGGSQMSSKKDAERHKIVTQKVHENGGKICMQILHTGRYAYHPFAVSSSAIKSPIGWFTPKALSTKEVYKTIDDFAKCAQYAKEAGYDGVEVMGSEGYLINQFICQRVNKRTDEFGGNYENRIRFPIEIVKKIRETCGPDFIIIFRLSMLDLVENGSTWDEIKLLANEIKAAGASIINTGIGWHEARVPTIATMVPRGGFTWVTERMKKDLEGIPLCTTNRINTPEIAEEIIANGLADMVSMARPFLADPFFVKKAMNNESHLINTCIGCNQACLDHIFVQKRASCLVNPRAAYETSLNINKINPTDKKKIAVVGAGPAGLAFSTTAAERGHEVHLFDKDNKIGGQFNMAKTIPGKEEFYETLRYFSYRIEQTGVNLNLNKHITSDDLHSGKYDAVVLATGVTPRQINLPIKTDKVKIYSYLDVLKNHVPVGKNVAIIGAGGIGFDVADLLSHSEEETHHQEAKEVNDNDVKKVVLDQKLDQTRIEHFTSEWGIDRSGTIPGALTKPIKYESPRKIYLLQRKLGKLGSTLGKTTGWIHKSTIKKRGVEELSGCKYLEVNDDGLLIERKVIEGKGKEKKESTIKELLPVDTIIICAGQESLTELEEPYMKLTDGRIPIFKIGGSLLASELDAKRAIDQGTRLAVNIETAHTGQVFNAPVSDGHKFMTFIQKLMKK